MLVRGHVSPSGLRCGAAVIRWLTPPAMDVSPSGLCGHLKGGACQSDRVILRAEPDRILAGGVSHRSKVQGQSRPEADTSLPNVLRVEFDLMPFQNLQEFLLKRLLAVMLHLAVDVRNDGILLRRTDGERSITVLPMEPGYHVARFVDVLTRVGFQFANKVGHSHLCWNPDEYVSVVMVATNSDREAIEILCNARHLGPNAFSELIVLQECAAFFGAENNVIEKLLMRGHVSLSGLDCGATAVRWLTPPAMSISPSGLCSHL